MDKISKALKKFSTKERQIIKEVLLKLKNDDLKGLNIQKLKGYEEVFRIRKRDIRIIIQRRNSGEFFVLKIDRKKEETYKNL